MANRREQNNQAPVPMPPIMPPSRRIARRLNEHRGEIFPTKQPVLPTEGLFKALGAGVEPVSDSIESLDAIQLNNADDDPRQQQGYI